MKKVEISTCSVIAPSEDSKTEESPLLTQKPEDPAGEYSWNKMLLEKEIGVKSPFQLMPLLSSVLSLYGTLQGQSCLPFGGSRKNKL
jgi:hypothetical protein